jgi:NAD(P)-dependent dehydrogenase (short-subunit alcohol dehydrogenase family)
MECTSATATVFVGKSDTVLAQSVCEYLKFCGYHVVRLEELESTALITGLVFDAGLLTNIQAGHGPVGSDLEAIVRSLRHQFAPRSAGGARVVALGTRDALGSPQRPTAAAHGGALVSTVRSLAFELGRSGVTVNLVAGLPTTLAESPVDEPASLLPWDVTDEDLAATAEFFLNARSNYVTGQVMYCCGGAQLLSSLSM